MDMMMADNLVVMTEWAMVALLDTMKAYVWGYLKAELTVDMMEWRLALHLVASMVKQTAAKSDPSRVVKLVEWSVSK
jgi:hypothetical protein